MWGGLQGGGVNIAGVSVPAIWTGTSGSWLNLAGGTSSGVGGVFGVWGTAAVGDLAVHASLWHGTPESRIDLNPAGALGSRANSVFGDEQVGYSRFGQVDHASLWHGSAGSWVDLQPAGATSSEARVTDGQHQGGAIWIGASSHAAMWSGSAASVIDLDPWGGAGSNGIGGMVPGQQVGGGTHPIFAPAVHALIWSGTAASCIDVNPFLGHSSSLAATTGLMQVGEATVPGGGFQHAGAWFGTAASFVDLHAFLPPGYIDSAATSVIQLLDGRFQVGGWAGRSNGSQEAILWTYAPAPGGAPLLVLAGFVVCRRRRGTC